MEQFSRWSAAGSAKRSPFAQQRSSLYSHAVQFYENKTFLTATASHFLSASLTKGEGAIGILAPGRIPAVMDQVAVKGIDVRGAIALGQLRLLDADELLSRFIIKGAQFHPSSRFLPPYAS